MVKLDDVIVAICRKRLHEMVHEMLDGPRDWAEFGGSCEFVARFTNGAGQAFEVSCKLDLDPPARDDDDEDDDDDAGAEIAAQIGGRG